jgi:hypothetical protein
MIGVLCDKDGKTLCGSDGYFIPDGRLKLSNRIKKATEYRERYKKHFRYKYDFWTHVVFVRSICELPSIGENCSLMRYELFQGGEQ